MYWSESNFLAIISRQQAWDEYKLTLKWLKDLEDSPDIWKSLVDLGCPGSCVQVFYDRVCGPKRAENYIFKDFMSGYLEVGTTEKHLVVYLQGDLKVFSSQSLGLNLLFVSQFH